MIMRYQRKESSSQFPNNIMKQKQELLPDILECLLYSWLLVTWTDGES